MNKKFLNAVLFGALLASSTGTFTSCKDYDDDINGLSDRVDAIEKTLAELNTKFGSLAYVKSVSFADGKLVVTDQSGNPTTYTIPNTDTNTTYTLEVSKSVNGNETTVTITLKGSDGSTTTKTFTLTDKDTVTEDTTLDPSLFWMDTDGTVWYGPKADKSKCTKTDIKVPMYEETTVTIANYVVDGKTLGWDIKVNDLVTHLNIFDVLPITSLVWQPEVYYNGIEAVEFPTFAYNIVKAGAAVDTTYVGSTATLSTFPGVAYFHVNPASATLAQIAGGVNGAQVLYKSAVNHTTRGNIGATATIDIKEGILAATIAGDMNKATTDADELDMLALQLTTTAGSKFTTSYFAVYNKKENVSFSLVDKDAFVGGNTNMANHLFATKWSVLKAQPASINADNMPEITNNHLVQAIQYDDAIAGIDLNTLFKVAMTKAGKTATDFDWAANKLAVEYTLCKYDVNGTDQINYAKLNGSKLTAVNYEDVNLSCIGKTPVVKITVKDTNNSNAVVAVSYIKLLYVATQLDICEDYVAPVSKALTIDWKCFVDGDLDYTSTVEYMSTKVYPNVGSDLSLSALSKEEFAANYEFVADQNNVPAAFQSKYITSITEKLGADNNADNRQVIFNVDEAAIKAKTKNDTYTFYGVYQKKAEASVVSSKYYQYPEYVAIPYTVGVQNYPTTATIKKIDSYRIAEAWENNFAICKGSKQTDNGAALYLNLTEALDLSEFAADYSDYSLEIVDPTPTTSVAEFGNEWCGGHGDRNWIVLTKQLTNDDEVIVPVKVYAVLCNGDKILSGTVNVKFINPAKMTITKPIVNVKDGLQAYTTSDLKKYITIKSSKDGSELYKNGALTALGEKILGKAANVEITLEKGAVVPTQWENKFALNSNGTVTWNLEGQNTLAKGQNATCKVSITIEYGKVAASQALPNCTISDTIGGSKLAGEFTIKAWNAEEFTAE